MEIEYKIKLLHLSLECLYLNIDMFKEQDSDNVDNRVVAGIKRAIKYRAKKIQKITGLELTKIEGLLYSYYPLQKLSEYFDTLRAGGIPVATVEDLQEFFE